MRSAESPLLVWRCRSCGGCAANLAVLRKAIQHRFLQIAWDLATGQDRRGLRCCPECNRSMNIVPTEGPEIDLCTGCQLMWFDADELDALPERPMGEFQQDQWKEALRFKQRRREADERYRRIRRQWNPRVVDVYDLGLPGSWDDRSAETLQTKRELSRWYEMTRYELLAVISYVLVIVMCELADPYEYSRYFTRNVAGLLMLSYGGLAMRAYSIRTASYSMIPLVALGSLAVAATVSLHHPSWNGYILAAASGALLAMILDWSVRFEPF